MSTSKDLQVQALKPSITAPEEHKEARDFLLTKLSSTCDPRHLLTKVEEILKEVKAKQGDEEFMKKVEKTTMDAWLVVGLDNHYALAGAVLEELRPLAIEVANQFVREYGCGTASEKALAEVAASGYIRVLQATRLVTRQVRDDHCSMITNGFYKVASQELDRANRHFINAITALSQLRQPPIKVTVKAETAFVANNQQLNAEIKNDQNKEYDVKARK